MSIPNSNGRPKKLTHKTASSLREDEEAYTYPPYDENGRPWSVEFGRLRPDAPVYPEPHGRAIMRIKRVKDGFLIWWPPH